MAIKIEKILKEVYSKPGVKLIYGPAGSGKSLFCLLAIKLRKDKEGKIIYIDCQSSVFPYSRLKQILNSQDLDYIKESIFFIHPKSFYEQSRIIDNVSKLKDISIIIIDNITYLYRLEKGGYGKAYNISKSLMKQIDTLAYISNNLKIPIVISGHIYSVPNERSMKKFEIVGGQILRKKAVWQIELIESSSERKVIIVQDGKKNEFLFRITENGIED